MAIMTDYQTNAAVLIVLYKTSFSHLTAQLSISKTVQCS